MECGFCSCLVEQDDQRCSSPMPSLATAAEEQAECDED